MFPFFELLLRYRKEITHPEPKRAIPFGFISALTVIREKTLFGEGPAEILPLNDLQLAAECARAYLAYLGVGTGAQCRERKPKE